MLLAAAVSFAGCGYQIAGRADTIPDTIGTIAVSPFENNTIEFKIEQYVTQAVVREFITRTRYSIVSDQNNADAVLTGAVLNFFVSPVNFDPRTGRAATVATLTQIRVELTDRATGERLYENPNFEFRERFEVTTDPEAYFDERQAAMARTSRELARALVSAVLEGF